MGNQNTADDVLAPKTVNMTASSRNSPRPRIAANNSAAQMAAKPDNMTIAAARSGKPAMTNILVGTNRASACSGCTAVRTL